LASSQAATLLIVFPCQSRRKALRSLMKNILSAVLLFLASLPVLAATRDAPAANAPVETVGTVYIIIFGVLFVGSIVGFFVYLFLSSKKENTDQK
jgi:hypothetical protein